MKTARRKSDLEADGMVPEENSGRASAASPSAGLTSCPQVRPLKHLCFAPLLKVTQSNRGGGKWKDLAQPFLAMAASRFPNSESPNRKSP